MTAHKLDRVDWVEQALAKEQARIQLALSPAVIPVHGGEPGIDLGAYRKRTAADHEDG
ncbi:MAG: hypothetical protein ABSE28_23640 [Candidatus Sulfotelmatobacter sp.]